MGASDKAPDTKGDIDYHGCFDKLEELKENEKLDIHFDILKSCSVDKLRTHLAQRSTPPDIVHFMCHGEENAIRLETGENRVKELVSADSLIPWLRGVKLVIFCCCYGGTVAEKLVDDSRLAIAIRNDADSNEDQLLLDKESTHFSKNFYSFLADLHYKMDVDVLAEAVRLANQQYRRGLRLNDRNAVEDCYLNFVLYKVRFYMFRLLCATLNLTVSTQKPAAPSSSSSH